VSRIDRVLVEVLTFAGCPHGEPALALARRVAAARGGIAEVRLVTVEAQQTAALRFLGSPSIRVDGRDIERAAGERGDFAFACRLYATACGACALPPEAWLVEAMAAAGGLSTPP
jgi:hypothetical protein